MWTIATVVVLIICCSLGVVMTAVRLPGTWLLVVTALGYGWWTGWERVGLVTVAVLAGAALAGEAVEVVSSVVTAGRVGASRQAAWGGLFGGVAGMLLLSFLVPIPLIGTMVGALLGCFAGAAIAELAVRRRIVQGAKVGLFAAIGFVIGTVAKTALALIMSGLLLTTLVCSAQETALAPDDPSVIDSFDLLTKDHSDAVRTWDCAFVVHLHALHHLGPFDQIGRCDAPLLVEKSFNNLVPDGRSVLGQRLDRQHHRAGFWGPFSFDGAGARC